MYSDVLTAKQWAELPSQMRPQPEQVIAAAINFLLGRLYMPTETGVRVDARMEESLGLIMDPINWGDLRCVEVRKYGDEYLATVEEAAHDARNLILYLEDWLAKWGWAVKVKTEW